MQYLFLILCTWAFIPVRQDVKAADRIKNPTASQALQPAPAAELTDLIALIGTWSVEERYEPSAWLPLGGTGKGTADFRLGPGGFSVVIDYASERGAVPGFRGHGVMSYSDAEKVYKSAWVDALTQDVVISKGTRQGDDLIYTAEFTVFGRTVTLRDVISDRTPTSFIVTSFIDDGSGEKKVMTLIYRRK